MLLSIPSRRKLIGEVQSL